MSLQDKLNENRNMSELFQETKELNELMKSYIRVHMNEEMAKEVTIHNQLNQIQSQSDKVMSNMQSILNKQETMLQEKDRKSTRLNSSHVAISYAVFCLKKKINKR